MCSPALTTRGRVVPRDSNGAPRPLCFRVCGHVIAPKLVAALSHPRCEERALPAAIRWLSPCVRPPTEGEIQGRYAPGRHAQEATLIKSTMTPGDIPSSVIREMHHVSNGRVNNMICCRTEDAQTICDLVPNMLSSMREPNTDSNNVRATQALPLRLVLPGTSKLGCFPLIILISQIIRSHPCPVCRGMNFAWSMYERRVPHHT